MLVNIAALQGSQTRHEEAVSKLFCYVYVVYMGISADRVAITLCALVIKIFKDSNQERTVSAAIVDHAHIL